MIQLPGVPTIRANRAMRRDRAAEPELPRDKPAAELDSLRVATVDPHIARHEPTEHQQVGMVSRLYRKSLVSGEVDFARQMEIRNRRALSKASARRRVAGRGGVVLGELDGRMHMKRRKAQGPRAVKPNRAPRSARKAA